MSSESKEGASGLELKTVVGLCDQVSLAFKRGLALDEIVEVSEIAFGRVIPNDQSVLRAVDSLGLVSSHVRQTLASCGVRMYNIFRALDPPSLRVFSLRKFAIRCMEAGQVKPSDVLLCYVRTGLKMYDSNTFDPSSVPRQDILDCFRRGFRYASFSQALQALCDNLELELRENYAWSIFKGAICFSNLEMEEFAETGDSQTIAFLCSLWVESLPILLNNTAEEFREDTVSCVRRMVHTFYASNVEPQSCLNLLNTLYGLSPPTTIDSFEDLLILAELQVHSGNRGLAYSTLEAAKECREKNPEAFSKLFTLSWLDFVGLTAKGKEMEEHESNVATNETQESRTTFSPSLLLLKESVVRLHLAIAEVHEQQKSCSISEDHNLQYQRAVKSAWAVFENIMNIVGEMACVGDSVSHHFEQGVIKWIKLSCNTLCNEFGLSEEMVRKTFLFAENYLTWASRQGVTDLRMEALRQLPSNHSLVSLLLEGIDPDKVSMQNVHFVVRLLWKRAEVQKTAEDDLDGCITSCEYLLEFTQNDRVLHACASTLLAECVLLKFESFETQGSGNLTDSHQLSRMLSLCKESFDIVSKLPDHHLIRDKCVAILVKISFLQGRATEWNQWLAELVRSPTLSTAELSSCAQVAVRCGISNEAISLVRRLSETQPQWTRHLVTLRLVQAGISPSDLLFEGAENPALPHKYDKESLSNLPTVIATDVDRFSALLDSQREEPPIESIAADKEWLHLCLWKVSHYLASSKGFDANQTLEPLVQRGSFYLSIARLANDSNTEYDTGRNAKSSEVMALTKALACLCDSIFLSVLSSTSLLGEPDGQTGNTLQELKHTIPELSQSLNLLSLARGYLRAKDALIKSVPVHLTALMDLLLNFAEEASNKTESSRTKDITEALPSSKLAQIGLFLLVIGKRAESIEILQETLQKEMGMAEPNANLVGKVLVLLVKSNSSQDAASAWVEQACQIQRSSIRCHTSQRGTATLVFPDAVREFLSSWMWNYGVDITRSSKTKENPTSSYERCFKCLDIAVEMRSYCPINHKDSQLAMEMANVVNEQRLSVLGEAGGLAPNELKKQDCLNITV